MDINTAAAMGATLAAIASGLTEWFKGLLAASKFDDSWSDEAHTALIQAFALAACVAAALVADFDLIHVLFPTAPITHLAAVIISGVALFLPADGLKSVLQFIKAARDSQTTSTVTASVSTSGGATATGSATVQETPTALIVPPTMADKTGS